MDANHASASQADSPAKIYEHYLGPAIAYPFTRVLAYAPPRVGQRVLDVACGTRSVARHASPLVGSSGKIVAVDVNETCCATTHVADTSGAAIEWLQGDATRLEVSQHYRDGDGLTFPMSTHLSNCTHAVAGMRRSAARLLHIYMQGDHHGGT